MFAVSYARVSSRNQEDNASLESQLAANRRWAEANNFQIVREVREVYSGFYLFDRPLLNEIRKEIKQNKYQALIVYDVDRLTRNMSHLGVLLTECERYNTRLIFVSGDFENSPDGKLLLSIKSYLAEAERVKITERTTRGRRAKAESGTLSYKRKLFGYGLDEDGKRYVLESEAATVRRIYESFLSGQSLRQIAAALNDDGIGTARSKIWFPRSVQIVLNNPAYAGRTFVFREKEVSRFVEGERRVQRVYRDEKDRIELEGMTPAIVSEDDFLAAQKLLQTNRKHKRGKATHDFLLRGFIRCRCGRLYSPHRGKSSPRYVCTSSQLKTINCKTPSLNADKTESIVWKEVLKILKSEKKLASYLEKRGRPQDVKPDDGKVLRLEREIERLVSRMATIDDKLWSVVQKEIEKRQREIEELKKEQPLPAFNASAFRHELSKIDYNELDFEGKVKILKMFNLECTFDGETLKINLGV